MKLLRRQFLHLAAGAAALPAVSRIASAQTYPARPVRVVVGYQFGFPALITSLFPAESPDNALHARCIGFTPMATKEGGHVLETIRIGWKVKVRAQCPASACLSAS
jgi:hypothetical protein